MGNHRKYAQTDKSVPLLTKRPQARAGIERTVRRITKVETAIAPRFREHFAAANATDPFSELGKLVQLPVVGFKTQGDGNDGGRGAAEAGVKPGKGGS